MRNVTAGALLFSFLCAATAINAAPIDAAAPAANPAASRLPKAAKGPAAKPATVTPSAAAASAAPCHTSGTYDAWLAAFEREALAQNISQRAINAAAPHLKYDQKIVYIDRGQRVFTQTFLDFSGRMAAAYRIQRGQALIKANASDLRPHRAGIRRARAGDRRVLGAGKRLRRQYGQVFVAQFDRLARLRLPAQRALSRPAPRCAAPHRSRRSAARRNDRLLGGRARPDPDDAVGIQSIRRRL